MYRLFVDILLIFSVVCIEKSESFVTLHQSSTFQLRKGNRRTQAIDALRLLLLSFVCDSFLYTY